METQLSQCPNCKANLPFESRYCPQCGQSTKDINLTFRMLVADAVEELFDVESRHVQTFKVLLTKPGQLTQDFWAGRRAKFIMPMRLFLFISVISIFIQNLESSKSITEGEKSLSKRLENGKPIHLNFGYAKIQLTQDELKVLPALSDQQVDSLLQEKGHSGDRLIKSLVKKMPMFTTEAGMMAMNSLFQQLFSYAQFLLMPFFAIGLLLFFRSPQHHFIHHLVHSIHLNTILFLIVAIGAFVAWSTGFIHAFWLQLLIPVYALVSLKRVYQKNWLSTILRFSGCMVFYLLLHGPMVILLALISLLVF